MAANTDFNYADILSLEKAKLANRVRLNFLGSQEMILDYTGIAGTIREDCVEYLEAERLSITDPSFGFKTYEGTWTCIDITYNEDRKTIRQRFKIDSSLGSIEADGTIDTDGDVSTISFGGTVERAYYWKIADPSSIELPVLAYVSEGEVYTKTANDNGDGTYDVIVSKTTSTEYGSSDAPSAVQSSAYTEETVTTINGSPLVFGSGVGEIPDAVVGEIKRIDNTPLDNGKFRTTVTTRTAVAQRTPETSFLTYGGDYSAVGGSMIIAKNKTYSDLTTDLALINPSPYPYVLSVSVRNNDYGLIDYTISGRI